MVKIIFFLKQKLLSGHVSTANDLDKGRRASVFFSNLRNDRLFSKSDPVLHLTFSTRACILSLKNDSLKHSNAPLDASQNTISNKILEMEHSLYAGPLLNLGLGISARGS